MEFMEFGAGVGHFKGGLYGFAGSGKTHTATEFALGIKAHKKHPGKIAMFDTETGAEYITPMVVKATGEKPIGVKSRTLGDAISFVEECLKKNVSVAIVDSTTHIWDEVQKSYLKQLNDRLVSKGRNPKMKIEWQDRGPLNDIWQKFTDSYLNSPLDIIICGRAANMWEMEVNEDGSKELNKVGTKMKTQSDMAYEPALLGEMERQQKYIEGKQVIVRVLTVLKDRFRLLDGKQCENPTFEFIRPHIECLTPGANNAVDTTRTTDMKVDDTGDTEWSREKRTRVILSEEISGVLTCAFPGQGAEEKQARQELFFRVFGTRSWTAIEGMDSQRLRVGLEQLPIEIKALQEAKAATPEKVKVKK